MHWPPFYTVLSFPAVKAPDQAGLLPHHRSGSMTPACVIKIEDMHEKEFQQKETCLPGNWQISS